MAKDTYYFSHDSNARNDPKIACLRKKYGWVGYGLYWAIIEVLRDQPCYSYPQALLDGLAITIGWDHNDPQTEEISFNDFVKFCCDVGLLIIENDALKSNSLISRMKSLDDKRQRLAEAGRIGGLMSSQAKAKLKLPSTSKVKESKVKEIKTVEDRKLYLSSVYLTTEEHKKLIERFGEEGVKQRIYDLNNGIMSKGYKYKSHYHTILSWERRHDKLSK